MSTSIILFLWTIVAVDKGDRYYDWRPMGDFSTAQHCEAAAKQLNLNTGYFRCLSK